MKKPYQKHVVLCDLENTLSNSKHRMHLLKEGKHDKFQEEFKNDPPNESIINFINDYYNNNYGIRIVILSAKKDKYRKIAELWLKRNGVIYSELIMQSDNDKRLPSQFKSDYVKENRNSIIMALDDVWSVCEMIRSNYIPVIYVQQWDKK